jgi:hypothetical protein
MHPRYLRIETAKVAKLARVAEAAREQYKSQRERSRRDWLG